MFSALFRQLTLNQDQPLGDAEKDLVDANPLAERMEEREEEKGRRGRPAKGSIRARPPESSR
jgi:hypothetical protein